jgi:nucleolar pre-ribosomal-associated protein 1
VTANLALLLKVFSASADFLPYGALLCKAVLSYSIAKRFNRSLSAPAHKESVISPILRLLTEIVRYDEGAHAKAVYAKRDFTLDAKILGRNIALWRDAKGDLDLEKRKPSIRVNAVRYLLAHLTYQDELAKIEILSNTNVVRAVFDHLHADPPFLIFEILEVMKNHVFQDKAIPRHVKSRILTGKTLSSIASLYRYELAEGVLPEGQKAPDELTHDFLRLVCTSPAYGVMLPSHGFYPPVNEEDDLDMAVEETTELVTEIGLDPLETLDGKGRIRNIILSEFIRNLRPYASTLQQELVCAIFAASPELIANYFHYKESFSYDPKLTSTWIGYSSFLYRTIELAVPSYLGGRRTYREYPPATSVVIQSILPQPLTQQVLVKCVNNNSDVVNFFAVRVLTVAFQKLRLVLEEYNSAATARSPRLWEQGAQRLVAEFCQRCPPMKSIILAFRRPAFQRDMMREAITRLLRLYYEVTPQVALEEKFDVSVPLCNALAQAEKQTEAPEDKAFRVMELEHWIQIARHSPSMRWWQKNSKLVTLHA